MRDVVKTNVKRNQNSKRARRRRRNVPLYCFLVIILVLGIGILLSVTLFFNINKIDVKGDVDYSSEEIIRISGIGNGDNMVRLDSKKAADNILNSMIYIEDVNIDKKYPDTLEINVTRCVAAANIQLGDKYIIVSQKGKILEKADSNQSDLITVTGFEPSSEILGTYIESSDEQKTEIYFEIFNYIAENDNKIVSIDMTDKYDIKVNYDNRINFELGNSNDVTYKLKLAETVFNDLGDDKKGTMEMIGSNQISFRSDTASDKNTSSGNSMTKIPIEDESTPESTEESSQDDYEDGYENSYNDENNDIYQEDYEYEENGGYADNKEDYYPPEDYVE